MAVSTPQQIAAGIPALVPTGQFKDQPVFALDRVCVVVGAREGSDLQLISGGVAATHAIIVSSGAGVYIRNLTGRPEVLVNGKPVVEWLLSEGDELQLGIFTFKFYPNGARFRPTPYPPAAIELANGTVSLLSGVAHLIGSGAGRSVQINDPSVSEDHAILFNVSGVWCLRDLDSAAGTFVNNHQARLAELKFGDVLRFGQISVRLQNGAVPQPAAPAVKQFNNEGMGGLMLGGMPVTLPEVGPPQGFGHVGVNFGGKNITSKIAEPEGPTLPPVAKVADPSAPGGVIPQIEVQTPRTAVMRNFPPVPKSKPRNNGNGAHAGNGENGKSKNGESGADDQVAADKEFSGEMSGGSEPYVFFSVGDVGGLPPRDVFSDTDQYPASVNDAAFGGQRLSTMEIHTDTGELAGSERFSTEVEDFSESAFWDLPEDEQSDVPLPERAKDLAPAIPPVGAVADSLGGLVGQPPAGAGVDGAELPVTPAQDEVFRAAADEADTNGDGETGGSEVPAAPSRAPATLERSPLRKPPTANSSASGMIAAGMFNAATDPRRPKRKNKSVKLALQLGSMALCMAVAAGGIYLLVPNRATEEGRLSFTNTPDPSSPAWQAFEAVQRQRVADPDLRSLAAAALQKDHPGVDPGMVLTDPKLFAAVVPTARFEQTGSGNAGAGNGDLVLQLSGTDMAADAQRLAAILKAMYQSDADLVKSSAAARQALEEWDPRITAKQKEISDLDASIAAQKKIVNGAAGVAAKIQAMQTDTDLARKAYSDALQTVESDQIQLMRLRRQLAAAATTQPSGDMERLQVRRNIGDLTNQINSLLASRGGDITDQAQKAAATLGQQIDQAIAGAQDKLGSHPDLKQAIAGARALQNQVNDLIAAMVQRAGDLQGRYLQLRRFIEQSLRRQEQIAADSDEQFRDLTSRYNLAATAAADAMADGSTATDEQKVQLQRVADDLERKMSARRRALVKDETAAVRSRLSRLIEGGGTQVTQDRQLIDDTLQTVQAQLSAAPAATGLDDAGRTTVTQIMRGILTLANVQHRYAVAVVQQSDDGAQQLLSLQDQLQELKFRDDALRQIQMAPLPAGDQARDTLMAAQSELVSRLPGEVTVAKAAGATFMDRVLVNVDAALALQATREAQRTSSALAEARDAKAGDLKAMIQGRDTLAQAANAAVDVKRPVDTNVMVVADSSGRNEGLMIGAVVAIGAMFGWGIRKSAFSR
jgi:pSer/pThr/pTyr-binding forkhead associated (FHA) protein